MDETKETAPGQSANAMISMTIIENRRTSMAAKTNMKMTSANRPGEMPRTHGILIGLGQQVNDFEYGGKNKPNKFAGRIVSENSRTGSRQCPACPVSVSSRTPNGVAVLQQHNSSKKHSLSF